MSTFVLVHARWHGAWCWDRVVPLLRRAGHTVVAPDRPSFDELCEIVRDAPQPVVLVGHSSSGMLISAAAERVPERVGLLVYVSAFLLPNGMVPPDVMGDGASMLPEHLEVDAERQVVTVRAPERVFFHDCAPAEAVWAAGMLRPEPARVDGPAVALTDERFGRVPRVYVECREDRALSLAAQRRMCAMTPCRHVYGLATGHAPFLAAPVRLAACLDEAARTQS